jgi:hypothetical protein
MTPQEELEYLQLIAKAGEGERSLEEAGTLNTFQRIMTGMGDVIYGGGQLLENATEAIAPGVADAVQSADEWLYKNTSGVFGSPEGVTMDDKVASRDQLYSVKTGIREGDFDGARLTGQILSGIAAPLARGLPALVAEGALFNSAMPTVPDQSQGETYWGEKAGDATVGAIGGVAGKGIQELGGHVINQYARPAIQRMREAGVEPTVGQSIGGAANTLEEAASSIPLVGPLFSGPRGRAQDEWQLSVLNRVVEPVGGEVTEVGTAGVSQASKVINDTYDAAFEAMPTMSITPNVTRAIEQARGEAIDLGMNEGAERQFNNILNRVVYSRIPREVPERVGPSQVRNVDEVTAENVKKIESELTSIINNKNTDRQLKGALTQMRAAIRQQAGDQSKEYRDLIDSADYSYAMFKRVTGAQNADVNAEGFTPAQLVRTTMRNSSENVAARGDGLMQADAQAAQTVLGNKLNNSGTSERLAAMALGTGGGALINPAAAVAAPLLAAGGSKPGQAFSNAMMEYLMAPAMQRYTPGSSYGLFANEVTE